MTGQDLARRIVGVLRAHGEPAWLVGGCVRDLLLGIAPKDFDVATAAIPARIREIFPSAQEVGAHFGVMLVREDGAGVEVATLRSDFAYRDGRRPEGVAFETDPARDAARRDFTINALFLDPDSGDVLDFVGGRADLAAHVIRAIGDPETRFHEDHLRLLRAVRFACRLGFAIDPATFGAMKRLAPLIRKVSAERVRDELVRILTEGAARRGFELLDASGLLGEILPEVARMKGVAQPPEYHPEGDVWTHTLLLLEKLDRPSVPLALGALLHDVGKPDTYKVAERIRFDGHVERGVELAGGILNRLRFSNGDIDRTLALIANHMRFADAPRMRPSTLKRFLRLDHFEEHLELHRIDCLSASGRLDNYEFVRAALAALKPEELKPPPLITGHDLIAAGYRPGPEFARVLKEVEDAQLEGRVATKEEALSLCNRLLGSIFAR